MHIYTIHSLIHTLFAITDSPWNCVFLSVCFMDWIPQFDITKSFNITAQGTGVAMLSVSIHAHTHDVFTSMLFCVQELLSFPLRSILSIMLCLKRKTMTVTRLISVCRWRKSLQVEFIRRTRHECKLLCCKIRLNYDVIFVYVVSYDGASESYQITIEYMWVYTNYSNLKKRFKVTHSSGAFVPLICLFWNVQKDQMIRWLFINL